MISSLLIAQDSVLELDTNFAKHQKFQRDTMCRHRQFLIQTEKEDELLSVQALLQPLNWSISPGWERILSVLHLCLGKCAGSSWSFTLYSKEQTGASPAFMVRNHILRVAWERLSCKLIQEDDFVLNFYTFLFFFLKKSNREFQLEYREFQLE